MVILDVKPLLNKIPGLLADRGMTISDLQRVTGMSYGSVHNLASQKSRRVPPDTRISTLVLVGKALDLGVDDLIEELED